MRRADEQPGRRPRQLERARPPRSSEVAIGFSTSTCLPASSAAFVERPVLVHAREHEDDVDLGVGDHGLRPGQLGVDVVVRGGAVALAVVDVVDGARRARGRPRRATRSCPDRGRRRRCRSRSRRGRGSRRASRDAVVGVGPRGLCRRRGPRARPIEALSTAAAGKVLTAASRRSFGRGHGRPQARARRARRTPPPPRRAARRRPASAGSARDRRAAAPSSSRSLPRGSRRPRPGCPRPP